MAYTTLITTAALALHLEDPAYVVVDCRFKLDDPEWGEEQYRLRHIPGAVYAHLDRDLSGARTGTNGRHPLPAVEPLAETWGRLGITAGVQVVAYDQDNGMFASRLWWMLRWLGHDAAAVLDGGWSRWLAEQRPTAGGVESRPPASFTPHLRSDMLVDVATVEALMNSSRATLLDARAPERYRGEVEPLDRVAGHIPGAVNHFFQQNVDERGSFRTPEQLRSRFNETLGARDATDVVCYCGSGVTACHNLLAMEHAGLKGARLYAGSWSEWSADPKRPVERGDHRVGGGNGNQHGDTEERR